LVTEAGTCFLEICVEHNAVSRLARVEPLERIVDAAQREVLRLRRNVVLGGKVEHRLPPTTRTGVRFMD
jgi:hypothetical protein